LQELMRQRAHGTAGPRLRLDDALWDRVRRLQPTERSLVEASAVAGVPTSLDLVAAAAGIGRNVLAQHMATLRGLNLVKISASGTTRRIEPYHDRVREAVVRNLGDDAMRGWHGRLARAIDASAERDVERLALHWEGAGDASRAAALLREAGDRASQAFAFDQAVELYQRAFALGGGRRSKDLELALAQALFDAGRGEEAGRAFLALAGDEADRPALELRVRAANAYFGSGYYKEAIAAMQSVLDAVDIRFPQKRLQVIASILWNRFLVQRRGFALADRSPATVPAQEVLRSDVCTDAAFGIGMADTVRGQTLHGVGVRLALDLGDARRAARSLCGFALAASTGGRKGAALTEAAIHKARQLASGLADPSIDALTNTVAGIAAYMIEDFIAAERYLGVGTERFQEVRGVTYELATARMMHGRSLAQLGRFDRMAAYQGPPLRDAIRRNDVYTTNNTRSTVSTLLSLVRDNVAACEAELAETARVLVSYQFQLQHVFSLLAACAMDLYRDAPDGVLARLDASRRDLRDSLF
jgi:tetratricopeptide (TPR) repeat protein